MHSVLDASFPFYFRMNVIAAENKLQQKKHYTGTLIAKTRSQMQTLNYT